jgi:hypothetical protein
MEIEWKKTIKKKPSYSNGIRRSTNVGPSHLALITEDDLKELLDINTCGQKEVSQKYILKLEDNDKVNDFISLVNLFFYNFHLQLNYNCTQRMQLFFSLIA